MADRALGRIDLLAVVHVGHDGLADLAHAPAFDLVLGLGFAAHPVEVGDHGLDLVGLQRQRLAVHGAQEAAIDAVLQRDDAARARRIAGEEGRDTDVGRTIGHRARVQVAAGAVQRVAHIPGQQVARLNVQAGAVDQLLRIGFVQHGGQARRLEGACAFALGIELLAHGLHLPGMDLARIGTAPAPAGEVEDVGDLRILELREGRHGQRPGVALRDRRLPARQHQMDQRGRVLRLQRKLPASGGNTSFTPPPSARWQSAQNCR